MNIELETIELLFFQKKEKNGTSYLTLGSFVKFDFENHQEAGRVINQSALQVNALPITVT